MTNKWLYSLIAVSVLLALGAGVWAYKSGQAPSVFGHSTEEIEGLRTVLLDEPIVVYTVCTDPKGVDGIGPSWGCGSSASGYNVETIGEIRTGTLRLPRGATEVLLYGSIDDVTEYNYRYIWYKHPAHSKWKRLVSSPANALYPNTNSVWLPLDENGVLQWKISGALAAQEYHIEIQGYRY
jgi:hypothetical protein